MAREAERKRVKDYMRAQEDEGRITIGDAVGDAMGALLRQAAEARVEQSGETGPEESAVESEQKE